VICEWLYRRGGNSAPHRCRTAGIRFVRIGDPPPENEPSLLVRPGAEIESEDGTGADD
jgi:hypothetical protein